MNKTTVFPLLTIYPNVNGPSIPMRIMGSRKWGIYGLRPNVSATVRVPVTNGVFRTKRDAQAAIDELQLNKDN